MKLSDIATDVEYTQRIASIGDNGAPEQTPYEMVKATIDDLYLEANNFLDGEVIDTPEMAEAVEKLEAELKAAIKAAEEARVAETRPLDERKAEVQARYNPLIGNTKTVTGTAVLALDVCKKALTPWRIEQQRIKDQAAADALAEAARVQAAAMEALKTVTPGNLTDAKQAGELLKQAGAALKTATKTAKATTVKTGLKTTYSGQITDLSALCKHVWTNDPDGLRLMMQGWVDRTVSSFGSNAEGMTIPGVTIQKHQESR